LLDTTRYTTPAHFTMNEYGNTVVHAPSGHGLQITSPATTTVTSSNTFLDLDDATMLADIDTDADEETIEKNLRNLYSFLDKN